MSSDPVYRRVGRGGAGNWYSKNDVDKAERDQAIAVRLPSYIPVQLHFPLSGKTHTGHPGPRSTKERSRPRPSTRRACLRAERAWWGRQLQGPSSGGREHQGRARGGGTGQGHCGSQCRKGKAPVQRTRRRRKLVGWDDSAWCCSAGAGAAQSGGLGTQGAEGCRGGSGDAGPGVSSPRQGVNMLGMGIYVLIRCIFFGSSMVIPGVGKVEAVVKASLLLFVQCNKTSSRRCPFFASFSC